MEQRVLIHAPRGRDSEVILQVLAQSGIASTTCATAEELVAGILESAAAAIVTEETIGDLLGEPLSRWLERQPSWSDFQFIVLATQQTRRRSPKASKALETLGNVILLERPLNSQTLASATEAAVRARSRQYATRRNLQELDEARSVVERLNTELEDRINARTKQLAIANDRLMAEIAERERAQAALFQAQKMEALGRLTGGIAHDFNNVLHAVSMNLEMIERLSREPKVGAIASRAKAAIGRGATLTGQLLSFARNQSLLPRHTDVRALLLGIKELVAVSVGPAIAVKLDIEDAPLAASLDATQLEMAVLNLAVNARDAMPSGGQLTISARRRDAAPALQVAGECVVVSVEDTGVGIPSHVLGKVFEPFFSTKPVGRGTGLGLSQVYGFVKQSGGATHIRSQPGRGTQVDLYFPLTRKPLDVPMPAREAAEPSTTSRPRNILVVEDDPDVRRVIV
ncbi:MAG: hybrid sensor histidine kinase/response regulator, partial [Rhizobacter sp.]|nr:hybrid sensor histidine kinase/response regulator [Rhizobacter sp.]